MPSSVAEASAVSASQNAKLVPRCSLPSERISSFMRVSARKGYASPRGRTPSERNRDEEAKRIRDAKRGTANNTSAELREALKSITGGKGPDVVFDPVGGRFAEPAFRSIGWRGRYLVIGFAAGEIPKIPLNLALLKGCSIVGVWIGGLQARDPAANTALLDEIMSMLVAGRVKPCVSAVYPLERVADALNDLKHRRAVGKIVITP